MKYKEGLTPVQKFRQECKNFAKSAKISPEVVFLRKARINVYILNANYIRFFALHR